MSYWSDRQDQLRKAAEKEEAAIKKRLSKFYDAELKKLARAISSYYQQYGIDNVIEYRTLLQSLDEADRTLLMEQMDEFAEKYPQYAHLLPVRESIYRLDRLQGLQYSVFMAQANIAGYTNEQLMEYETKLAQQGLNYSMETLGFGKNFYSINDNIVQEFVDVPWCNGENFSTRIWNDTQRVAEYINRDMAQAFARGDSYDRIVKDVRRRFGVNRSNAYRLVFTEGTYVMAESSIKPFEEDFTQYEYSPILDGKTCEICRALNGKIFEISERQPGVNFPPMHPWCRCTWLPYVEDWDKWMDNYEQRHRGEAERGESVKGNIIDGKMTDDDIQAINRYISANSYIINSKLRKGEALSDDEKVWEKKLDDAIMKLPDYKGIVYRSVDSNMIPDVARFMEEHETYNVVSYPAYTSSSTSVYDEEMDIQMIIESSHGKDMRQYNASENEIIFKRDSKFFVTKKEGNTIWLKEM